MRLEGTQAPGSGLGLALVSQQAGTHAATIEVSSSPLGGARFEVRFCGDRSTGIQTVTP